MLAYRELSPHSFLLSDLHIMLSRSADLSKSSSFNASSSSKAAKIFSRYKQPSQPKFTFHPHSPCRAMSTTCIHCFHPPIFQSMVHAYASHDSNALHDSEFLPKSTVPKQSANKGKEGFAGSSDKVNSVTTEPHVLCKKNSSAKGIRGRRGNYNKHVHAHSRTHICTHMHLQIQTTNLCTHDNLMHVIIYNTTSSHINRSQKIISS